MTSIYKPKARQSHKDKSICLPTFSWHDVQSGMSLSLPDGSAYLDVALSGELELLTFITKIIDMLYASPFDQYKKKRRVLADIHAHELDEAGRFYLINQLASLKEVQQLGLIQRKILIGA